jgi:NarL family two-component system response regulator YdfI
VNENRVTNEAKKNPGDSLLYGLESYNQYSEVKLIQVIIIAPVIATRAGLRALLSEDPQISVVAEAGYLSELEEGLPKADVLVWLPGSSTDLEAQLAVVDKMALNGSSALLMVHDDPAVLSNLVRLPVKVWGLLSTEATQAELIAGVQALNEGLIVIHPPWINQISSSSESRENGKLENIEELTSRELEILGLLALGLTNKQIAARLKISAHTVKFHVSSIFSKLGTTNRVETVNLGLKKGLIVL